MSEIKKILYPTDFSRLSARALPHVLEIANRHDAHVTMLHVLTPAGTSGDRFERQLQWWRRALPGWPIFCPD